MAELGFEPRIEKHSQKHFRLLKVTDRRYIFYRLCGWGHNYASSHEKPNSIKYFLSQTHIVLNWNLRINRTIEMIIYLL